MDSKTLEQIRSIWPDVATPFSRIVPDGCVLARAIDDWRPGLRTRRLELTREEGAPALLELIEEACEDAERRGWCPLDDAERAFELEGVILRVGRALVRRTAALWASFEQPWPKDAGAPVETSEAFQNMVRKALGLGGEPLRLSKEITVDPFDISRIDSLKEAVDLPLDQQLITRFPKIGFTYDEEVEAWSMGSVFGDYEMIARVRESFDRTSIEVTKTRLRH
jgi:hypothetical protein